jgi:branched-chain amino acid transport system substrate-binding protein
MMRPTLVGRAFARLFEQVRGDQRMQKYLRWSAILAVTLLVLAACGPGGSPSESAAESMAASEAPDAAAICAADELGCVEIPSGEPIHIAYWGVLSGADATLGTDSMRGVEIAIDDRGGTLLDHEIELTTEDGLCTPEGGATAAQKLAADSTLVGLIGSSCSDETVGGIQTITEAGLTTISPSNTRPALTAEDRGPEYAGYLRTAHSDAFQGKAVAEFVFNELGLTKAATIHDGSAYAEALQQVFADEFTALGGEITIQEAVSKGQTDMVPVLTRVAATAPEVVYYPIFIAEGGFITAQIRDVAGLEDAILIGSDGMFSPDFVTAAGPNAENMYLSSPDFTAFADAYQDFLDKHTAKYGENPLSIFHAHAYDATNMLFDALEDVSVTDADGTLWVPKGALRERLFATKDFEGLTGTLTCSPTGDCGAPVIAVYQITATEVNDPTTWPPDAPIWPER